MSWKRFLLPVALVAACVARSRPAERAPRRSVGRRRHPELRRPSGIPRRSRARWAIAGRTFTWEASFTGSYAKRDMAGEPAHDWSYSGLDLRWNIRDAGERATPFFPRRPRLRPHARRRDGPHRPRHAEPRRRLPLQPHGQPAHVTCGCRRATSCSAERGALEFSHHIAATAGLQYAFRGKYKDRDLDGVRNWLDMGRRPRSARRWTRRACTSTPTATASSTASTSAKARRRAARWMRRAASSTRGRRRRATASTSAPTRRRARRWTRRAARSTPTATASSTASTLREQPEGRAGGRQGCPTDADGDGVFDGLDQCAATPAGLKVDPNGCPIEVSERDGPSCSTRARSVSQGIQFDVNKATIKPESFPVLDEVAAILQQYPALTIEIGGHTDNTGREGQEHDAVRGSRPGGAPRTSRRSTRCSTRRTSR